MPDLIGRVDFWLAMLIVISIKFSSGKPLTGFGRAVTVIVAVGSAVLFTTPVMHIFELDPEVYEVAMAAFVALTGEHVARQVLATSLQDLISAVTGRKK